MHTITDGEYEWDPVKAEANAKKHGVHFADAALSLEDPRGFSMVDPDAFGEARWVFIGADPSGHLLVTVYTMRHQSVRIVSSRRASGFERARYAENL